MADAAFMRPTVATNIISQGSEWGSGYKYIPSTVTGTSIYADASTVTWVSKDTQTGIFEPSGRPNKTASATFNVKNSLSANSTITATPQVPSGWVFYAWVAIYQIFYNGSSSAYWQFVAPGMSESRSQMVPATWSVSAQGVLTANVFDVTRITAGMITWVAVARPAQITYHANDGTSATSSDAGPVTLPTQTRSGYRFDGWYTAASGGTRVGGAGDTYTPTADVDLYAHWTQAFAITYSANGGSSAPAASTAYAGETWTCTSSVPTRTGYTCLGWNESPSGTSADYVAGASYQSPSANLTLYAVWSPNSGVLIYNANGGTVTPGYKSVLVGETYGTLPTPRRTGYDFAGWYTAASGGTQVTSTTTMGSSGTATIYAQWTATTRTHTLTFEAVGGTISGDVSRQVTEGAAYGTLPTPTRTGYTFVGWFASTVGDDQVTSSTTMGSGDVTIYAHWTRNASIVVTFDANGNGATTPEASRSVVGGMPYGKLPLPTYEGHNFEGWYTAATGGTKVGPTDVPSSSLTLYAQWTDGVVTLWDVTFS